MEPVRAVTGIDLPAGHPGGSMVLLEDIYGPGWPFDATVFTLPPDGPVGADEPSSMALLEVAGTKALDGRGFWDWVLAVTTALREHLDRTGHDFEIVHCQHLAFGMTPALLRALPHHRRIGLVHGTDLIFAAAHRTQLEVLREAARLLDAIVVPTAAMADWLLRLAPDTPAEKIVHIPWGVPDLLLLDPPPRRPRPGGPLRLLFAGRLSREKGAAALLAACAGLSGIEVAVIGPEADYAALRSQVETIGLEVDYLGWLDRPRLWRTFADFDVLAVPSTTLEAFCLTAIEAQACGLAVLYQPVPGLSEVLGDTGLAVDLADPAALRSALDFLAADRTALAELRRAGHANAARFPLSVTAAALAHLSRDVADRLAPGPRGGCSTSLLPTPIDRTRHA